MPPKPTNWGMYAKMLLVGGVVVVGGPALVMYVTPTEEELFKKYNPDLQKRSLERRHERQQEFDDYVTQLKKYSKSDKPIWTVWEEDVKRKKALEIQEKLRQAEELLARQKEMRKQYGSESK